MTALRPMMVSKYNPPHSSQTLITCHGKPRIQYLEEIPQKQLVQSNVNRRVGVIATMASLLLIKEENIAYGLDLKMVAPEQTLEEAENGVQNHAKALLQVKDLIDSKSWREAQKELRKSSSLLKQDIYTIIQGKPGGERPQLRKLYSNLFNNVTKLDYAARDEDASGVWQCYENIVLSLNDILSKL
ncbi:psbQ-like protein 3, chloroplastic [Durio zibethinus]|uniref:PsbQ-like protein 3, chloroplastic n=1 Tax=Durio zibethinus TaxID=66656 RepID=A0A6P5XIZ7_DURZI|nr:psbQ-like protein 3, chloroplastic [Durio zibethinus]XP_022728173.1 psbQ-like protein 3, chloroplastic [Durio zibethinus]